MSATIWKYVLPDGFNVLFTISMPANAEVLTVQAQAGNGVLWALVDPENAREDRRFLSVGTGLPIQSDPERLRYIGSYQIGIFVFHLFEVLS